MTVPLPPLPPIGDDESYRPGGRSVLDILTEEHEQIVALCRELTDAGTSVERRREVAEVVAATLTRHLSAEQQYLHPAVRAVVGDGAAVVDRQAGADRAMEDALQELLDSDPDELEFGRLAERVAGEVHRHVTAATQDIFPGLRAGASEAELIRLGNRVEIAEEAAPTRPHPDVPNSPHWNKLVDPALGVVDKVRDAVTGRPTYAEDLADDDASESTVTDGRSERNLRTT
ncbi:hemerythrin domain-containing protein [Micromonospora polyrhachis]|uniref:Hemerythrin-like domain-containing protein n=1 Tax=Micromonospora polyrhachis TaxID=1282883 RepID=A0A7W7SW84_9ACTN|nr:hemerythrin domain-containing protein [Micromonospora polyrhachis]MBB4962091.1 hypothetical protein [Micromonospora polyrhachis]